ncbi:MAG: helicase-related protein [Actinoallomurus sp.]
MEVLLVIFEAGQKARLPSGPAEWVTIDFAHIDASGRWILYVACDGESVYHKVILTAEDIEHVEIIAPDGCAPSARALAGMWSVWFSTAARVGTSKLRPYPHQVSAVFGAMLPQPRLRFLLADEPGTGKTVMAGLYLRELQQVGKIRRALVVAPAGLVSKWQADFERFFDRELRRITSSTVQEGGLGTECSTWIVSLELAAVNPAVLEAIHPDHAGWDLVIFDEAHRLTPTAQAFHTVGRVLSLNAPAALLMTATPHRGSEWLFRHLLHLVDPEIYPSPGEDRTEHLTRLRPGSLHFLRRMKEDLVDHDGVTPLFRGRRATNHRVPMNAAELMLYERALSLVDTYFPKQARPLARMVYSKRAASSLHALARTLHRRQAFLDAALGIREIQDAENANAGDEATVVGVESLSGQGEQAEILDLLTSAGEILAASGYVPSKWRTLVDSCLADNEILPGNRRQAVVFTEYADSAEWIAERLSGEGFAARVYSGRQSHTERDDVRRAFMAGEFQVIVSTDAGNEGIDLQVAHVLVNYDIPWSLVRLEQRMGRIHRIGQTRDVELYNLVAADTREGDVLLSLLENFVNAAGELNGQLFDSLSVIAELGGVRYEDWLSALYGDDPVKAAAALAAVDRLSAVDLRRYAEDAQAQENALKTPVRRTTAPKIHPAEPISSSLIQSYLRLLDQAGLLEVRASAISEDVMLVASKTQLSADLVEGRSVLAATAAAAFHELHDREGRTQVVAFTAGHSALTELVLAARRNLAVDVFHSGTVVDLHAKDAYDLVAFDTKIDQVPSPILVRIDPGGLTQTAGWDILTRLLPTEQHTEPKGSPDVEAATRQAHETVTAEATERQRIVHEQLAAARRELNALPVDMTMGITDRNQRLLARNTIASQIDEKLGRLEALSSLRADEPRLLGWLRVIPRSPAIPDDPSKN